VPLVEDLVVGLGLRRMESFHLKESGVGRRRRNGRGGLARLAYDGAPARRLLHHAVAHEGLAE
jgi:hypothetical protein